MCFIVLSFIMAVLIGPVFSYKLHNALSSIIFTTNERPTGDIHSEYYFGVCASKQKVLMLKHVFKYEEIKDKIVVRVAFPEDMEIPPNCIYIRAKSAYSEIVRYHAFKFNICICRILYNYGGKEFENYYYEWYIPVEMMKEMVWELYFYNN